MKDSTYKKYCLVVDEWFVNGFNGTKSYLKFYVDSSYESADSSFRDIVEIPRIKEYIKTKQSNKSLELDITLTSQLKILSAMIAEKDIRHVDKINALKEQNKLLALYREHNNQKKTEQTNIINLGTGNDPNEVTT